MKILVLGGTGTMGAYLTQQLASKENKVYVTTRTKQNNEKNVSYIQGNALDLKFLKTILDDCWDVIVDFMTYSTSEFKERVNLLLNATTQYVFLSSARVYTSSVQQITETSPRLLDISDDDEFLHSNEYSLSKARQEDILKETNKNNWTIIRPYITYSEKQLQLGTLEKEEWLNRALNGKTIIFSKDIIHKETTMTHGFDVARGIIALLGKKESLGEIYHITSNKTLTWGVILGIYLEVLERYLRYKPKVLLLDLEEFLECKPTKYQTKYDRLFNRSFDNSKISQFVDINSFIKPEDGLKESLESFLINPKFNSIDWRLELIKDRQTGDKTSLKEIIGIKHKIKYLICQSCKI